MYKKVYVEITNNCNLKCEFCTLNKRENKFISIDNFKTILEKLEGYTNYLYLHVLGEPLMHPNINELIDLASNKYDINITTNGFLIKRLKSTNVRQINISLHSYNESYNKTLDEYMNDIFEVVDNLKGTFISYRIWVENEYSKEILNKMENKYQKKIIFNERGNCSLEKNIFVSYNERFIWPSLNNSNICDTGTCYALRDHIGILVDGSIIPCCLDGDGIIKFGNIYENSIEDIINMERYQNMLNGFKENKKVEELCKRCNFIKKSN